MPEQNSPMNMQQRKKRVREMLYEEHARTASDLEWGEREYNKERYSVESTKKDVKFIDEVLNLPATARMEFADKDLFRLKAIQGRNLSHLLLNEHKNGGDSEEMLAVKDAVAELEETMAEKAMAGRYDIEEIESAYQLAIAACKKYCDQKNPHFPVGIARKQRVQETLERLQEEARQIALSKELIQKGELEDMEIKQPQDLLVLAQLHLSKHGDPIAELETKEATGVHALTFEDFAKMVGTLNRGEVSFENGKLNIISNSRIAQTDTYKIFSVLFGSDNPPSTLNRQMQERLYEVVKERVGDADPDYLKSVRKDLGLDNGATKAAPLSRALLAQIVAESGYVGSDVRRILKNKNKSADSGLSEAELAQQKAAYSLASEAQKVFDIGMAGANEEQKQAKKALYEANKAQKKELMTRVTDILKKGKKLGVDVPSLSEHQMGNLVNGNLSLVQDQIFSAMNQIYQMTSHLQNGAAANVDAIAADQDMKNKLAALVISRFTAETEEGKELREYELQSYIREMAFRYLDEQRPDIKEKMPKLQENCNKMYVDMLSGNGANGLDLAVESRLLECKAWEGKIADVRKGTEQLRTLCEQMRELYVLQETAFAEGLSETEAVRMDELGTQIQKMLSEDAIKTMEFVAKELKGTRFAEGLKQAKKMVAGDFSFETAAKQLSEVSNTHKEKKAKEPKPAVVTDTEEKLIMMDASARKVAEVLLLENLPSTLVEKGGDEASQSLVRLRDVLRRFPAGKVYSQNVKVAGVDARLIQKADNSLYFVVNKQPIRLTRSAQQLGDILEEEMMENTSLYGEEHAKKLMGELDFSDKNPGLKLRSINMCIRYLAGKTKRPSTYFTNVSGSLIRTLTTYMMAGDMEAQELCNFVDSIEASVHINGEETKMLLKNAEQNKYSKEQIIIEHPVQKQKEDELKWSEEESKVQDLIADLIYSKETWTADEVMEKPGIRLQKMLMNHLDTLILLLKKPELLKEMLDKLPFPEEENDQEEVKDIKTQVQENIQEILEMEEIKSLQDMPFDMMRKLSISGSLFHPATVKKLAEAETLLDKKIKEAAQQIQAEVKKAVDEVFKPDKEDMKELPPLKDPNEKDIDETEKNKRLEASRERLEQIMKNAAKGSAGQGLFIKNVLSNYFVKVSSIDQRAMLASAVRSAKPIPTNLKELAPKKQEQIMKETLGNYLGGVLKGAGPLLQKMLQGMPTESMPEELQGALKDMKSNLAPIPEKIVRAQLQNIMDRSNKKITSIKVEKAMGAASVGQTFLCKVYGPGMEDGKDVVIKLLRPDVRNRMMREKEVMLWCAKLTDKNVDKDGNVIDQKRKGGMEATFEGQLLRYEEELDLTIEAKNAQKGSVYDKGYKTIGAMKLNTLVQPTTNALVLEKAPGTTVDKYLDEVKAKENEQLKQFYQYNEKGEIVKDKDGEVQFKLNNKNINEMGETRQRLAELLEELRNRQKYMAQLAQSWVMEGIYGGGFYHGDLHAGNIMINDSGLTVIDFGNATQLDDEQKKHVTRMMMAAALGNVEIFRNSFHMLLENTPENVYQDLRDQLTKIFTEVFKLGDESCAGLRIATALMKAQELGIELPSAIFNFSQSQMRLQNAIEDMNKRIASIKQNIQRLEEAEAVTIYSSDVYNSYLTDHAMNKESETLSETLKKGQQEVGALDRENLRSEVRQTSTESMTNFETKYLTPSYTWQKKLNDFDDCIAEFGKLNLDKESMKNAITSKTGSIRAYIKALEKMFSSMSEYNDFVREMESYADDFYGNYSKIVERLQNLRNRKNVRDCVELEHRFTALREAQQNPDTDPKELERLEKEFCDQYEIVHTFNMTHNFKFNLFRQALRSSEDETKADIEADMQGWYADTKTLGEELCTKLRTSYEAFRFAQLGNAEDTEDKMEAFLAVYHQALGIRISALQKNLEKKVDESKPDSFADATGEIIKSYLKTSIRRLGRWNAFKYRNDMNME